MDHSRIIESVNQRSDQLQLQNELIISILTEIRTDIRDLKLQIKSTYKPKSKRPTHLNWRSANDTQNNEHSKDDNNKKNNDTINNDIIETSEINDIIETSENNDIIEASENIVQLPPDKILQQISNLSKFDRDMLGKAYGLYSSSINNEVNILENENKHNNKKIIDSYLNNDNYDNNDNNDDDDEPWEKVPKKKKKK